MSSRPRNGTQRTKAQALHNLPADQRLLGLPWEAGGQGRAEAWVTQDHFPGLALPVCFFLCNPSTPGMVSGFTPWANKAVNPHPLVDRPYTPGGHYYHLPVSLQLPGTPTQNSPSTLEMFWGRRRWVGPGSTGRQWGMGQGEG